MNRIYAPALCFGMLAAMSKRRDSAERWREILRRQAGSGLSVVAFCRRSRIPQATFYLWRRKLRDTATFAEVRLAPEAPPAPRALELILSGGRSVVVRPGFDRATLLALVDALEHSNSHEGQADVGAIQTVRHRRESGA